MQGSRLQEACEVQNQKDFTIQKVLVHFIFWVYGMHYCTIDFDSFGLRFDPPWKQEITESYRHRTPGGSNVKSPIVLEL